MLNSLTGKPCIKVATGVEYVITEQKVSVGHMSHGLVFQHILHNMCVCVSVCVGEVSRAKPSRTKLQTVGVRSAVTGQPSLFCCVSDVVL